MALHTLYVCYSDISLFFFINDAATTEIYTLSLHDALPILELGCGRERTHLRRHAPEPVLRGPAGSVLARAVAGERSEEHTSELQSRRDLVCRLLLEKKKKQHSSQFTIPDQHHAIIPSHRQR